MLVIVMRCGAGRSACLSAARSLSRLVSSSNAPEVEFPAAVEGSGLPAAAGRRHHTTPQITRDGFLIRPPPPPR